MPLSLSSGPRENPMKQVPVKQVVRVGEKTFVIVNGQVLTSKEAKEARPS